MARYFSYVPHCAAKRKKLNVEMIRRFFCCKGACFTAHHERQQKARKGHVVFTGA